MKKNLSLCFLLLFAIVVAQNVVAQDFTNAIKRNGSLDVFSEPSLCSDSLNVNNQHEFNANYTSNSMKLGFQTDVNQSQSIRDEWLKRGGKARYVSAMLTGTYFNTDVKDAGKMNGYGGGYSIYMNWLKLKMPEYTTGRSNWNCLNWGLGYDLVIYGFKYDMNSGTIKMNMNTTVLNLMFTGNFGWTWGFGKYIDEGNWKGVALTLKYRPSYNISSTATTVKITGMKESTTSASDGQFNAAGFGFDLDFTSYSATMNKLAPKPKSKFSFFFLPPVGNSPLFVSVSYGLVFYPKARIHKR